MRKLFIAILAFVAVVAGIALYLVATAPKESAGVRFPLNETQRALVARVPASAEAFAVIPTAAALDSKLRANPVTRDAIAAYEQKHAMPRPWMLGGADLLVWRDADGATRYFVKLDPFRAAIVRFYRMVGGDIGDTLLINAAAAGAMDAAEREAILALAAALPPGDAFVVQRSESRGAFPPIARPAVTAVAVTSDAIELTSVGRVLNPSAAAPAAAVPAADGLRTRPTFPRTAILTATFTEAPKVVDDLNRLFGTKVSPLLENGGTIAVYDVDAGKLLPRPLCVIAIPADDARRAALRAFVDRVSVAEAVGLRVRTGEKDGKLLLSFDNSLVTYLKDVAEPGRWPGNRWALRIDAQRLAPILRRLGDSLGLRIAAPRLFRSARDLERWIGGLERASTIEAADSDDGVSEVLKVRITAK